MRLDRDILESQKYRAAYLQTEGDKRKGGEIVNLHVSDVGQSARHHHLQEPQQ
jgi:hypothetical protein